MVASIHQLYGTVAHVFSLTTAVETVAAAVAAAAAAAAVGIQTCYVVDSLQARPSG